MKLARAGTMGSLKNIREFSRMHGIQEAETSKYLRLVEHPENVGKTEKQILLKNPILSALKRYFFKQGSIKNIVATHKQLDKIIEDVMYFAELCTPTKARLRDLLQIQEIDPGEAIPVVDPIKIDFIYVVKGALRVCF